HSIEPKDALKQNGSPPSVFCGLNDGSSRATAGLTRAALTRLNVVATPFARVGSVNSVSRASIEIVTILRFIIFPTMTVVCCEYRLLRDLVVAVQGEVTLEWSLILQISLDSV